ncbi:MAG: helix-turn-helix domain-containing protein [Lachnospiraceae bacterium]|nr:helix-turn-helix domain-containing protein [Lachnospiraceae bacterium]
MEKVLVDKRLLDIKELCIYLGIGQTKARELLRGNNGFGVQIGNRWYANKKKLDVWIDNVTI